MSWPSIRMRPAVRRLEAGKHAQQRGLAAAGGAEQREELAAAMSRLTIMNRGDRAEALRHAIEPHKRRAAGQARLSSRNASCSRVCRTCGFRITRAPRVFSMMPSVLIADNSRVTCSRRQPMRAARM